MVHKKIQFKRILLSLIIILIIISTGIFLFTCYIIMESMNDPKNDYHYYEDPGKRSIEMDFSYPKPNYHNIPVEDIN